MATLTRTLTHSELLAEIAAGTLHKGESITISDYRTVHTIPSTTDTNTGDLEPLLVTAISNNELKPEAYSLAFPDDVIYYNPVNDQTKVAGCTKGYIYRRIDTKQSNDFPFDFRQVKFRRWQINAPDWVVGTTYAKGNVVQKPSTAELYISLANDNIGNPVTDVIFWRRFEWDNLSYVSWTTTTWIIGNISIPCTSLYNDYYFFADGSYTTCFSNQKYMAFDADLISQNNTVVFGANFQNNTIGTNFNYNSIGSNFQYNRIGANFRKNTIGTNFQNNTIGANFQNNSIWATFENNSIEANFQGNNIGANFFNNNIGANFNSNSIGAEFYSNSIGDGFYSNSIGTGFSYNSIEAGFNSNTIGGNFHSNTIGVGFSSNSIEADFNYNSIGANFKSNTIGAGFNYNTIESGFDYNTIGTGFSYNSIEAGFNSNTIGVGFYSNSIGTIFSTNTIGDDFSYNSIGAFFNYNSIGANFKYNNVLPNLTWRNLTSTAELYNKLYPHTLARTVSSGIVITWYNSTGVLESLFVG